MKAGDVEALQENRYYILTDTGMKNTYDEHFGLNPSDRDFDDPDSLMA